MPRGTLKHTLRRKRVARRLALAFVAAVLLALYAMHFAAVAMNAVDVPFRDEWEAFTAGALTREFPLRWLFAAHNEHRHVFTKLQIWLLYRLDGWNLAIHQVMNFALFGMLLVGLIVALCRTRAGRVSGAAAASFIVFLLSPAASETHFMGWNSSFHFQSLFVVVGVLVLFRETPRPARFVAGGLSLLAAVYSAAGGLPAALVVAALLLFVRTRAPEGAATAAAHRRALLGAAAVVGAVAAGGALWLVGKPFGLEGHPPMAPPWTPGFWVFLANLVSWGFGVQTVSAPLGALCLAFVLAPPVVVLARERLRPAAPSALWMALLLAQLASLALIAVGRGGAQEWIVTSKASRYALAAALLLPLAAAGWMDALGRRTRARILLLLAFWLACGAGYADNWNFSVYRDLRDARLVGLRCLDARYHHGGRDFCATLYPRPFGSRLARARALEASFWRSIERAATRR